MIIIGGKKYREVRYGTNPIDVTINGITVADDAVSDVNLTLVDQNGDDVPFTQTGTELEIPDATITLDSEPFLTVASGSTTDITLEDEDGNPVNPIGSDGSTIIVPNAVTDLFWELNFNGTDDVIFIPATVGNVGTFTSGSGSNVGTITVSTDGIAYGTLAFPFTPTSGTTYYFKRSTATVNGLFTLIGTY